MEGFVRGTADALNPHAPDSVAPADRWILINTTAEIQLTATIEKKLPGILPEAILIHKLLQP